MAQNEIKIPLDLLDKNGRITQEGWARRPFWRYDRQKIKASAFRIKEWDYYYILSSDREYGITFTMADLGYTGLFAVTWLDFKERIFTQYDAMSIFPLGRTGFPSTSEKGDVVYNDKKIFLSFRTEGCKRIIRVDVPFFVGKDGKGLAGEISLYQKPEADSMVIATSWKENRKAFYYNQKINCMPATGNILIGTREFPFAPEDSFGGLDWGRGHWTYRNRWYWGSASGLLGKIPFGWNIGYGFSDRSPASENMVFYDSRAHKLEDVFFRMDTKNYMSPWKFTSSDGRFEMDFTPLVDRNSALNLGIIKSVQHQVFGLFNGFVVLDNGKKLAVKNFLGFAEDVLNWW
jgi:hypothetical protein